MKFEDNDVIRYLTKEMDRSEELLFEQRISKDEDLLIEVESMRRIMQRLSDLPEMDPPRHLSRNVLLHASSHLHDRKQRRTRRTLYLSAAASVLIAFSGGWLLIGTSPAGTDETAGEPVRQAGPAIHVETTPPQPAPVAGSQPEATPSVQNGRNVEPWVDTNQELRFTEGINRSEYDSLLHRSYQRLQPVDEPAGSHQSGREGLHLTGQGQ